MQFIDNKASKCDKIPHYNYICAAYSVLRFVKT